MKKLPEDKYLEKICSPEGHRKRLRERFLNGGMSSLADYEAVELLLTLAIPRCDVKRAAKILIAKFGNIRGILDADFQELTKIDGIGNSAAICIKFIKELIPVYMQQQIMTEMLSLDSVDKLIAFFRARMANEKIEVMEMACFNSQLELLPPGAVRIFEGGVSGIRTDFRKIIETAINAGAESIVLAHNHPGGDCSPSAEDLNFTRQLSLACRPIGLSFIEHIIITKNSAYSFRRGGHFDKLYERDDPQYAACAQNSGVAQTPKRLID